MTRSIWNGDYGQTRDGDIWLLQAAGERGETGHFLNIRTEEEKVLSHTEITHCPRQDVLAFSDLHGIPVDPAFRKRVEEGLE